MNRVTPASHIDLDRTRQGLVLNPIIYCDIQDSFYNRCRICYHQGKLINPCPCLMKYHQSCILGYIRTQLLAMRHSIDLGSIRCKICKQQFKVRFLQTQKYGCSYFCQKIQQNWCEKYIMIMFGLILLIIALTIGMYYTSPREQSTLQKIFFSIIVATESISILILIGVIYIFVQKNLKLTQITLFKVYQWNQRYHSADSIQSQDQQIYSENFQIIIDEDDG